jgi:hypothetical protein
MLADLSSPSFYIAGTVTPEQKWNAFHLKRSVSLSQVNLVPKYEVPAMENKPFLFQDGCIRSPVLKTFAQIIYSILYLGVRFLPI